jgi:HSP20 family protein
MANLTRWDPFSELSSLQDRVNQVFSQGFAWPGRGSEQSLLASNFVPPVDVYEDDHSVTVQVEVPGVKEEDLDVRLENNVLTISGERKLENEEKKENFHRIERQYGRFVRSFTLPSAIDPESVNAEFNNGMLKITLAKREESKPKQIKIGAGKTSTQQPKQPGKAA